MWLVTDTHDPSQSMIVALVNEPKAAWVLRLHVAAQYKKGLLLVWKKLKFKILCVISTDLLLLPHHCKVKKRTHKLNHHKSGISVRQREPYTIQ